MPRGPLTLIAKMSNICSGVSWPSIDGDAVWVGVPKLPVAQFGGAGQEEVAPDRVLGAVGELLEGVGVELRGAAAWF